MKHIPATCLLCLVSIGGSPSPSFAAFLDQHVEIVQPNNLLAVISSQSVAQTFLAGFTAPLDHIELEASRQSSPSAPLVIEFRATLAGGAPDTSAAGLMASAMLTAANVPFVDSVNPSGSTWVSVHFPTSVNLTANTPYAIVLSSATSTDLDKWYYWAFSHASSDPTPYPQGEAFSNYLSPTFLQLGNQGEAFGFRTFLVPEPNGVLFVFLGYVAARFMTSRRRQ